MSATAHSQNQTLHTTAQAHKARMAALSTRVLHPDILLPILAFLPRTHLPPLIRTSRYLHNLVGPLLYADLPIPPPAPSAICPHLSPLGSLFLSAGGSFPPSTSDLRAVLHDRPSRKRLLLESARTLRLDALHTHQTLPPVMRDLRLDMRTVDTLHLVGGTDICHHPTSYSPCPFYTHLQPKVVVVESNHLALGRIGGLSRQAHEGIGHLVIKLRPSTFGMYPPSPIHSLLNSISRVTIVFTPHTHLDKEGRKVTYRWRPSSRSACGEYYWEDKPSFTDMLEHMVDMCEGVRKIDLVGAEVIDREWMSATLSGRAGSDRAEKIDGEWLEKRFRKVQTARDGGREGAVRAVGLDEWRMGVDSGLLEPAPISAGIIGKGVLRRR